MEIKEKGKKEKLKKNIYSNYTVSATRCGDFLCTFFWSVYWFLCSLKSPWNWQFLFFYWIFQYLF